MTVEWRPAVKEAGGAATEAVGALVGTLDAILEEKLYSEDEEVVLLVRGHAERALAALHEARRALAIRDA